MQERNIIDYQQKPSVPARSKHQQKDFIIGHTHSTGVLWLYLPYWLKPWKTPNPYAQLITAPFKILTTPSIQGLRLPAK